MKKSLLLALVLGLMLVLILVPFTGTKNVDTAPEDCSVVIEEIPVCVAEKPPVEEKEDIEGIIDAEEMELHLIDVSETVPEEVSTDSLEVIKEDKEEVESESLTETENNEEKSEKEILVETKQIIVSADSVASEDAGRIVDTIGDYAIVEYESSDEVLEAFEEYQNMDEGEVYAPTIMHIADTGKADYKGVSWGYDAIHANAINKALLEKYGSVSNIPEVYVAVIDTGVDYTHELLAGRVVKYNNDYVDDDYDAMDEHNHGTHVSGIIADTSLSNVKIFAYRVLDEFGQGYDSDIAQAIKQAANDGADVINLSLGKYGESIIVEKALEYAIARNVLIVAAAGNDNTYVRSFYPASFDEALTVSASNRRSNGKAEISNYGAGIDIAAPGVDINSSISENKYEQKSGTSMSAPFVAAGAASLIAYLNDPSLTYKDIGTILKENTTDILDKGFDIYSGYGIINMKKVAECITSKDWIYKGITEIPKISVKTENGKLIFTVTAEAGASIYFTTDGTYPTVDGSNPSTKKYNGPFSIDKSVEISVLAKVPGKSVSDLVNKVFNLDIENADFEITSEGVLTKYLGNETVITIPDVIRGITVKTIGRYFAKDSNLEEVYINDTVSKIEEDAFYGSGSMKMIHIGKNVQEIGFEAFYGSRNLEKITVDSMNQYFVEENNVLYTKDYKYLISANAYANNYDNDTLTVDSRCRYIWHGSFWGGYLDTVFIPAGVEDIDYQPEGHRGVGDQSIVEFVVDSDNPYYYSENGAVYSKDKTILYGYSRNKTDKVFVVPNGVKIIDEGAFYACDDLQEIVLNEDLESIRSCAFEITGITTYRIPASVKEMGGRCLNCEKEVTVYFDGNSPKSYGNINGSSPVNIYKKASSEGFEGFIEFISRYCDVKAFDISKDSSISVSIPEGYDVNHLYLDGVEYETSFIENKGLYVVDSGTYDIKTVTAYKLNASGSPIGMYVWTAKYVNEAYVITEHPELTDILNYKGFSIRIRGYSGIRYKADILTETKEKLASEAGFSGFKLKEYGVLALPTQYLTKYPLVVGGTKVNGTVDYKRNSDGSVSEILFERTNGYDSFTGLLINIPESSYNTSISFRSYIILENGGVTYTIYQMPVTRSIYYLANQYISKNMYEAGTYEYDYLISIINVVEGKERLATTELLEEEQKESLDDLQDDVEKKSEENLEEEDREKPKEDLQEEELEKSDEELEEESRAADDNDDEEKVDEEIAEDNNEITEENEAEGLEEVINEEVND